MRRILVGVLVFLWIAACGGPAPNESDSKPQPKAGQENAPHTKRPSLTADGSATAPRRAVFSLQDNRLLAHHQRQGSLVIPAGSAGFAKYAGFWPSKQSWELRQARDGVPVALARRRAKVRIPLTDEQAKATDAIAIRIHALAASQLSLEINGKDSAAKNGGALAPGWQTLQFPVASGRLRGGENHIELKTRGKRVAIESIAIGPNAGLSGEPAKSPPGSKAAPGLALARGDGLAYYVEIPKDANLAGAVREPECEIAVAVSTHQGERVTGTLGKSKNAVDLSGLAGQVARVELTAGGCARVHLDKAALTVPGTEPNAAPRGKPPKYLVLWVMDTLRADYVRPFNPSAVAEVPNWERLAKSGAVFSTAYAQGPESQSGHGAMFTGLYSIQHGLGWKRRHKMEKDLMSLGPTMKKLGFYNVGVTGNGFVTVKYGYGRGFDVFKNLMRDGFGNRYSAKIPAIEMFKRGIAAVEERRDEPFFLFLGTIDTHKPWVAYEPWISRYDDPSYKGTFKREATGSNLRMVKKKRGCVWNPGERDLKRILALYASDVSYQDSYVGKLLDTLEEWGIAEETMIILTADHGEELWEHGRCGHGYSIRAPIVHVPLLIHYPPLFPQAVVREGVELVDLFPTILDALGQEIPPHMAGQSLIPLSHGIGRGYPRPAFASMPANNYKAGNYTMRLGDWKARATFRGGRWLLFDAENDFAEKTDLAEARPLEFRFVTDPMTLLLSYRQEWPKTRWGVASNMSAKAAQELNRRASATAD